MSRKTARNLNRCADPARKARCAANRSARMRRAMKLHASMDPKLAIPFYNRHTERSF